MKIIFKTMRKWVALLTFAICLNVTNGFGDNIFSENMGVPSGTTLIMGWTGWQNNGVLTFTGTGDVRNTTVSSGYTGASGDGNVFLTNTVGRDFEISGINTTVYSNIMLSAGIYKSTTASNGSELLIEVSADGVVYTPLTFSLPTGTGTAAWYLVAPAGSIPSCANLRIRFTQTGTVPQFRIDDVVLSGVIPPPGNALNFDGTDDYVQTNIDAQPTAITTTTWECWFKPTRLFYATDFQAILSTDDGGWDRGIWIVPNTNQLVIGYGTNGWYPEVALDANKWYHIAIVYKSDNVLFYLNGKEFSLGIAPTGQGTVNTLTIGASMNGANQWFQGQIDEVRIWNIERSITEIKDNRDNPIDPASAGLVTYYPMDHTAGTTTAQDITVNGFNGTLISMDPASCWSESFAMVVPVALDASGITQTSFTANWSVQETGFADKYLLDISTDPTFASFLPGYQAKDMALAFTENVTGVNAATNYYYRVKAYKTTVTGQGAYSSTITATTIPYPVEVTGGCGKVNVVLTASGAISGEDYKWYDAEIGGNLLQTDGNTFTIPVLAATTTYYVTKYNTSTLEETTPRTPVVAKYDDLAPVPDVTILPNVNGECSVTSLVAPTATDECVGGPITGSHNATLPYTTQGTYVVTWTYNDGNGNTSTQTQNVVVDDVTTVVPDLVTSNQMTVIISYGGYWLDYSSWNIKDVNNNIVVSGGPYGYASPGIIAATVNFSAANGPFKFYGISQYGDNIMNYSIQCEGNIISSGTINGNQTLTVPNINACLPNITAECITLTAPTGIDACAGPFTATTSDPTLYNTDGTYLVTWNFNDGNGNPSTQLQNIIIDDITAPVADVASLPDVTGECSVTVTATPTATDNCVGSVTGTTTDPLTYTAQGTYTINWSYNDGNGNFSTQTQTVIVDDITPPVADVTPLLDVTAECEVTSITVPTATDNCVGTVNGTPDVTFPITAQGTTIVTWTHNDGNGNTVTQLQNVIIDDVTVPVPDVASLPNVTGECSVTVSTAPTATDNCVGSVTGTTTDPLTYTAQGTYTINWSYNDGNGNTSTQTQSVVIDDITAPVADAATLPDVIGQCSVEQPAAPTATDNCAGTVTVTQNLGFPITTQGTYTLIWSFDDGNGNVSTQNQTIIVDDTQAPTPDAASLADVTAECSVTSLTAPTATDNCTPVTVSHDATLPITAQGTTVVTWTYADLNGNFSTQTQNVVIEDITAPEITGCPSNIIVNNDVDFCSAVVSWVEPQATDNCLLVSFTSNYTPGSTFPVGTTTVIYTATDIGGNISTCSFDIIVNDNQNPTITCPGDMVVCASDVVTYSQPIAADNCTFVVNQTAGLGSGILYPVGETTNTFQVVDASSNTASCSFTVTVNPLPPVTANSTDVEICAGEEITLTGAGAVSYTWDNGVTDGVAFAPVITGINIFTYTVTGIDANNCYNTAQIQITVNNLPLTYAGEDFAVCENGTIQLFGSLNNVCTENCAMLATCTSTAINNYEYISNVTLNGASQSSGGVLYADYTSTLFTTLYRDSTYTITGSIYNDGNEYITAYIDWNRNGVFDAGESISILSSGPYGNPLNFTKTFTVPSNAILGETKLRVVLRYAGATTPCGSYSYGETEDYKIEVKMKNPTPISYAWFGPDSYSSNDQNPVISSATLINSGIYTVSATDGNGCTNADEVSVTVNQLPSVTANTTDAAICIGESVTLTGGNAVSYVWDNGVTDNVAFAPTATTTYNVTGTDVNNCYNTAFIEVVVNPLPTAHISGNQTICNAGTALIPVTFTGTAPWSFTYSDGVSTYAVNDVNNNPFNLAVNPVDGAYELVTVNDANCTGTVSGTATITVTKITSFPWLENFEGPFPPSCWAINNPDGSYTWEQKNVGGNSPGTKAAYINFYSYNDNGQQDDLITPLLDINLTKPALSFKVSFRPYYGTPDQLGVYASMDGGVTYNATPIYLKSGYELATGSDYNSAFTPSVSTEWRTETIDISSYIGSNVVFKFQGTTQYGNNLYIDDVKIYQQPTSVLFGTQEICPSASADLTLSLTGTAPWSVTYTDGTTPATLTGITASPYDFTVTPSATSTYTLVNVIDANGLGFDVSGSATVTVQDILAPVADAATLPDIIGQCSVEQPAAPTATDNCVGTVTGTGNLGFPITTQGTYTLIWTYDDGQGNTSTQDQTIIVDDTQAPTPDATSLADVTAQCSVTSLTAPTATDNCTSVTVTNDATLPITAQGTTVVTWSYEDLNGNISTQLQNVIIDDVTAPEITGCPSNITVNNDPDLCSAVVTWTEPQATDNCTLVSFTSNYTPGSTFPVGITTVIYTATDIGGNTSICEFTVTVNDNQNPTITCPANIVVCASDIVTYSQPIVTDNCTFVMTQTAGLGSGILYPVGETTNTFQVIDASNNNASCSFTVNVNPLPTVTANTTDAEICAGEEITLTGGGAVSYVWDNGVTDNVAFEPTATTTYTVTGTDANNCSNTALIEVVVNALPNVVANTTNAAVCIGAETTLYGSGAVNYSWDNGVTDNVAFAPTATTTYTVTGTDANNCSNTALFEIAVNALPNVVANTTNAAVCIGAETTLYGSGAVSYNWDNGVTDNVAFAPTATTTYNVTGTDANNCSNTDAITVNVYTMPTADAGIDVDYIEGHNAVQIGSTPVLGYTYAWSPETGLTDAAIANPLASPTATTTFTVTVTNGACQAFDEVLVTFIPTWDITGLVSYDNDAPAIALNNVKVYLMQYGVKVDSVLTDAAGAYTFLNQLNGNYEIDAITGKAWGGGNATDAQIIQNHYVGNITLTEPRVSVADVNASNAINSTDALLIKRRFANLITSFPSGDWYFNPTPVVVGNADVNMDFKGLCFGDVNGSYTPPFAKITSTINLISAGTLEVSAGSTIDVPVRVADVMQLGAASLIFTYPQDKMDAISVQAVAPGMSDLITNIEDGKVYIAWNSLQALNLQANDVLLSIRVQLTTENPDAIEFGIMPQSEFADVNGMVINNSDIMMPALQLHAASIAETAAQNISLSVFPNPITENSVVQYVLPENGNVTISVFDMNGKLVSQLVSQSQVAGTYTYLLNAANLAEGTYHIRFMLESKTQMYSARKTIVHVR